MLKQLWNDTPTYTKWVCIICLVVGLASVSYTFNECGFIRTLMLGKGGVYAAYTGMCDE